MTITIKEGIKAPDFTLPANNNDLVSLSKFMGMKVVLYFYPKDDTPGCTLEAKDFMDHLKDFAKLNTVILGISKDDLKSHNKFVEKYCLPFTLLSDADNNVCENYGVYVEKSMYGKKYMGIERTTFLIDENGKIMKIWNKVKVEEHVKEVLKTITELS